MPIASSCPHTALLERVALDQLSAAQQEELARHLEHCERCVRALEGLPANDTLVEALRGEATLADRPEGERVAELVARLKRLRPGEPAGDETTVFATAVPRSDAESPSRTPKDYPFLGPARGESEIGWLGPYRVLRVLGAGGMGVVFEAEDTVLERRVALKTMKPAVAADPAARQRFLREARAAAAIKNDHVVTLYQVGEAGGVPYLAMELLEGESLDAWLKRGRRPSPAQLLRMAREMALGLAAAHERGLIHRDIKPANIWLEMPRGRIKVLDFGLARGTGSDAQVTQSGAILGSPAFMAPEQAAGEPVDPRCDLFSLGCVLYRLATGVMPFKGSDTMSVLRSLALDHPPPPRQINPQLPPALSELIEKLLAKDRAARPASAREVVGALTAIERETAAAPPPQQPASVPAAAPAAQGEETVPTRPLARRGQPGRWRPWVAAVAGLLLLLGGATLAAVVIRIRARDGRVTEIQVPRDAIIEISQQDNDPPPAPAPRGADRERPFVLLRAGKTVREFRTMAGLLAELQDGDVIEAHSNGPLALPRIALRGRGLTLRAGPGFRPLFEPKGDFKTPWIEVHDASVRLEGCDFRCPPVMPASFYFTGGSAEIHRCRVFQPDTHNSGVLVFEGPRLHISDSLMASGFSHWAYGIGAKAEVEVRRCIFWNGSYALFNLDEAGGQSLRVSNSSFAGGGNFFQLNTERKAPEPVRVEASENVFSLPPHKGSILTTPLPQKEWARVFDWHGRDNTYHIHDNVFSGNPGRKSTVADLAGWQALWGKNERGGQVGEGSPFQLEALHGPVSVDVVAVARPILQAARRDRPGAGPILDRLGPGDAYLRALAAAGKPVPADELRPECEEGGPVTLLHKGKAVCGYASLAEAVEQAADGDVIELRTDREVAGIQRPASSPRKVLTLRAGPGYRPVIIGGLFVGSQDGWTIEGLHFQSSQPGMPALAGSFSRLAGCSFDSKLAWVQFQASDTSGPCEVVNCSIPAPFEVRSLAPGRRLRLANCLLSHVIFRPEQKGEQRLELEKCLVWAGRWTGAALSVERKETPLTVLARDCVFETSTLLRMPPQTVRWQGAGNVYRVGNITWAWEVKPEEEARDLVGWKKVWQSDTDSVEQPPLRYDPRQWRLLPSSPGHGTGPGGKDRGADVESVATTGPTRRP